MVSENQPSMEARVRNLRKKLAQVVALAEKLQTDPTLYLTAEQNAKLERKAELEDELRRLMASVQPEPEPQTNDCIRHEGSLISGLVPEVRAAIATDLSAAKPDLLNQGENGDFVGRIDKPVPAHGKTPEPEDPMSQQKRGRLPSGLWEEDPVAVEDVAALPSRSGQEAEAQILEAVQPFSPATRASPYLRRLTKATTELSIEAFTSDVIEGVSKKGKWKLTLLARPEGSTGTAEAPDPWGGLLGFIAYRLKPHVQSVSIAKLAVVPEHRGKGYGHKLVQWCIAMAKRQPNLTYLSLTSLPQAVKFYKRIGFRHIDVDLSKLDPIADDDDSEYVEGQVYMEYRCKGRGGNKKRG